MANVVLPDVPFGSNVVDVIDGVLLPLPLPGVQVSSVAESLLCSLYLEFIFMFLLAGPVGSGHKLNTSADFGDGRRRRGDGDLCIYHTNPV